MSTTAIESKEALAVLARLERLPATRHIWFLVTLLSLGAMIEMYDLFLTAYVVPGLVKAGLLANVTVGIFTGPAVFVAATFTGLFIGTAGLGFLADRIGRRKTFTLSMLWYSVATIVLAFQNTGLEVCLWRLIGGIGIGVQIVTIDTYVAELMPKSVRGRAFAFEQAVQAMGIVIVAFVGYLMVPTNILGLDGWRWVVLIGSVGALFVWVLRINLPESPRWLINQGRLQEAEAAVAHLEAQVTADLGGAPLPPPSQHTAEKVEPRGRFAEIWAPAYRKRTIMLMIFQFFQTFGYYGFAAWVPTLIEQKGINLHASLLYSFVIAIANPFGPLLAMSFADRFERKWQLVTACIGVGLFGVLFALQTSIPLLILFGVLITLCNNIMSYSFHSYQTEVFPTRVRARAVGFTYSFSRISVVFASFIIAFFLQHGGVIGVFGLIAFAMMAAMLSIGILGPRTRMLELEQISH